MGEVAYELALPSRLPVPHPVFHVSILKKYMPDGSHRLQYEELDVQADLSFEEEATWFLEQFVKVLRRKVVPLVKVV